MEMPATSAAPRRHWWLAVAAALVIAAALALWFWPEPAVTARPALWKIEKNGRHAYLFGTVHAVPAGARWLSPAVAKAARESDLLILEVTGLGEERRSRATFDKLGKRAGLPPVVARLSTEDQAHLATLSRLDPAIVHAYDGYESWAAALLISANVDMGRRLSTQEAGEERFTLMFKGAGKPIGSLETVRGQLGLFDAMPEHMQRRLLSQGVQEADRSEAVYDALYARWAAGDMKGLNRLFAGALGGDPALRAILIDQRNARWAAQIDALLARHKSVPFIAVGAGHLIGPGNVPSRLAARGWRVTRIK